MRVKSTYTSIRWKLIIGYLLKSKEEEFAINPLMPETFMPSNFEM